MGVFNDKKREFAFADNAQVAQSSSVDEFIGPSFTLFIKIFEKIKPR